MIPGVLLLPSPKNTRWFIRRLQDVSPGNLRALWLPYPTDTTTNLLKPDGRTWTSSASIQGRITYQGVGILVTFASASSHKATTADTDDLSNGNGTNDSAFSVVAFANVTDTAAYRVLAAKYDFGANNPEYALQITNADKLSLILVDKSTGAQPSRDSTAAITHAVPRLFGASYSGLGGATAANGITLYTNGVVEPSSATNSGSYVAMENTAAPMSVGALNDGLSGLDGSLGFAAEYAVELSPSQHASIASACRRYYKVAL